MVNGLVLQKKMQRLWDERGESTPLTLKRQETNYNTSMDKKKLKQILNQLFQCVIEPEEAFEKIWGQTPKRRRPLGEGAGEPDDSAVRRQVAR